MPLNKKDKKRVVKRKPKPLTKEQEEHILGIKDRAEYLEGVIEDLITDLNKFCDDNNIVY